MSQVKFAAAKELITEKHYDVARAVLRTMDNPQAQDWLGKLDKLAPPSVSTDQSDKGHLLLTGVLVAVIVILVGGILIYTQRQNIPIVAALFVSATPTSTMTPSLTSTSTLTSTYTPTQTLTPSNTSTPTLTPTITQTPTITPTLPPIPGKLAQDQIGKMLLKCMNIVGFFDDLMGYDDFIDMGGLSNKFLRGDCSREEAFQVVWYEYTEQKAQALKTYLDKTEAWSQFITGWESANQSRIHDTATMSAYRTAQPTEMDTESNAPANRITPTGFTHVGALN